MSISLPFCVFLRKISRPASCSRIALFALNCRDNLGERLLVCLPVGKLEIRSSVSLPGGFILVCHLSLPFSWLRSLFLLLFQKSKQFYFKPLSCVCVSTLNVSRLGVTSLTHYCGTWKRNEARECYVDACTSSHCCKGLLAKRTRKANNIERCCCLIRSKYLTETQQCQNISQSPKYQICIFSLFRVVG